MTEKFKITTNSTISDNHKNSKIYAVMLFDTELQLGISNTPYKWVNIKNYRFEGKNAGLKALEFYANVPCESLQLIDANSEEELLSLMNQMNSNYQNQSWLEENVYPNL